MKLNSLLTTLFVCLLFTASFAQKVDLDPWRFTANFRNLPLNPLDKSYCTYNVSVASSGTVNSFFSMTSLETMVGIADWKPVTVQGHVTIYMSFGDFRIVGERIAERTEEIKDKDQKVIGKKIHYKPVITYTFQVTGSARDYKGTTLFNSNGLLAGTFTWEGSETQVYKQASDALSAVRVNLMKDVVPGLVNSACANMTNNLSKNYGWGVANYFDLIYLLDSKKHPEFEGHQKVVTFVKEVLGKKMNPNESLDDIKAQFEPLKDYLLSTVKTYDKDEKSHKKMRYAAYYALSTIYYWLDDPDNCIKYADALIANEYDEKDGKRLIERANDLKSLFAKNNTNTRHFKVDTASFEPPK